MINRFILGILSFFLFLCVSAFPQPVITDTCKIPSFSISAGFYLSPVTLVLASTTAGSSIYFTLDGSDPTEQSSLFSASIAISETSTVRARCYSPGLSPSRIATGTYFINENISLPVVSLATDPYNLYDPRYGIFVYWEPYYESNLFQDWERPVHVEFFEADGTPGFSLDAGIKVHGGLTRAQSQKALNIYARSIYGTSKINYKLFNDRSADSYDSFVLRNGGNDFKWTLFRDEMMHSIVSGVMGFEQAASRPAIVFLNGMYYGIQHIREKVSDNFIEANTRVSSSKIDMLEYPPYVVEPKVLSGSADGYTQLTDYLNTHDLAVDEYYNIVAAQVDIQNFINYQVSQIYFDNGDWPGNNVKWWRPNDPAGKWRWILFDTDFGFGLSPFGNESGNQLLHYLHNTLLQATQSTGAAWPNPPYSNLLFRSLLKNIGFKNLFINTFCDHLNTTFRAERVNALINSMKSILEPEIPRHHQKYPESAGHWATDVQVMTTFANERVNNVFNHLMAKFMLQRTLAITLNVSDPGLGTIQINTQVLSSLPWSGRYYPGIALTLTARPKPGCRFVNWSDGDLSLYKVVEVTSGMPAITANFETATGPVDQAVVINEINYRSSASFDTRDWVELYNNSDVTVDLGGWVFKDNSDDHSFIFSSNLILEPWSFLVLCRNSTAFKILQPDVKQLTGDLSFKFSSTGDELRLFNSENDLVDNVAYSSFTPWPDLSANEGFTLELTDPKLDNSLPESWKVSGEFAGSPGLRNSFLLLAPHEIYAGQSIRAYPNPFSDRTTIEYFVGENIVETDNYLSLHQASCKSTVEILTMTGQVVRTLSDQEQAPGTYQVTWEGNDASGNPSPSGIYFCRITGNRQQFTKLLLIR